MHSDYNKFVSEKVICEEEMGWSSIMEQNMGAKREIQDEEGERRST